MSTLRGLVSALTLTAALGAVAAMPASAAAAVGPVTVSPTTNSGPTGGGQTAIITVPGASGQVPVYFGAQRATVLTELPVTTAGGAAAARYTVLVPAAEARTVDVAVGAPAAPTTTTDDDYTYVWVPNTNITAPTEAQCGPTFQFDTSPDAVLSEVRAGGEPHPATQIDAGTWSWATPDPPYAPGITYPVTGIQTKGEGGGGVLKVGCFYAAALSGTTRLGIQRVFRPSIARDTVNGGTQISVTAFGNLSGAKLYFDGVPAANSFAEVNSTVCLDFEGIPCPPGTGSWIVRGDAPPHAAGSAEMSIRATDGTISYGQTALANDFLYYERPEIRYRTPLSGPVSGGNTVEIEVVNPYVGAPVVTIGGAEATDRTRLYGTVYDGTWDKTRFRFTVPPATAAGPAEIRVTGIEGAEVSTATYTYEPDVTPTPTPTATPWPTATTGVTPVPYCANAPDQYLGFRYDTAGSATLKTLTKGSLPLAGKAQIVICPGGPDSGKLRGSVSFAEASGNLTALGFLPVTAKVNLVATEQVTGSLTGTTAPDGTRTSQLVLNAKVRVKLPSVKTFGIELAGGANCQAKQITAVTLKSTQPLFNAGVGGPVAGTFAISDLSGCGFLTGIVSPLTAGSGNAIALNLTPGA